MSSQRMDGIAFQEQAGRGTGSAMLQRVRDAIHDIDTRCDDDNIHVDSEKKNDTSTTTTTPPPPIRKVNQIGSR